MTILRLYCPACGRSNTFKATGIPPEDIRLLVALDGRACRVCGARLVREDAT